MALDPASPERKQEIKDCLGAIRERVATASSSSPTLVAVSKYKPAGDILACHELGHLDFGENYVQELEEKAKILPSDIRWHFIGTLQSNKAKTLALIPNLYSIQTLGSVKAANALNKALSSDRTTPLRVLLQVNTSGEDAKSGLPPLSSSEDVSASELGKLAAHVIRECPALRLEGLMTIGSLELSIHASETEKNADFERLKQTRDILKAYLETTFGEDGTKQWGQEGTGKLLLSMGMSSDFETALKAGSDIIRVGSSIFGGRPPKPTT
ncbi:proline synthetase associated protein [Coprinopsis cinerea okayama7|uniref:Pyridoxal phosphate homeostasis protein n=1 Tax=Coprinopsis cinerea (strain Okayama-7 / 130 / ATCC MYA-4618 / FGSC 9003) TaxID=240176 RepID=A8P3S4_COPC7|nr:proline synthetase associated protein [Coprinopsis cinerea okayama7\|eukprot:XP_001838603.2 proline synthetase associated protein [Coprinopsis cinerea okayama7\